MHEYKLDLGDALTFYQQWDQPTVIVSDGPYGVGGYEGDPTNVRELPSLYEPHIAAWAEHSLPSTVLWFWNTELGWATVHPVLERHGWKYHGCNIWNKGIKHVAGNCNGKTMRSFPVVTEVCVQYVRDPKYIKISDLSVQDWLRSEWKRTGLPFSKSNEACGVANAATRKYLTADHMFYFPPPEIFERMRSYANQHGDPAGRPYFELSGAFGQLGWWRVWYNWNFEVWDEPAIRGQERLKLAGKVSHLNQKPLALMTRIIKAVCQPGDVVWEPFGGLASASVAAIDLDCCAFAAEINPRYHALSEQRLAIILAEKRSLATFLTASDQPVAID